MEASQGTVQPQPVPQAWRVHPMPQVPGGLVVVEISGPEGTKVCFMKPDFARQVGQQLIDVAGQARSGLVVAPAGSIPRLVRS